MREFLRFKSSLFPGFIISVSLIIFAFSLFYTLINAQDTKFVWSLQERTISLLKFTIFQAFLSTVFSIFIGLLLAWSLAHKPNFMGRQILITLFSSSLVLPTLIVVFGLITVYGRHGWINSSLEYFFGYSYGTSLYGLTGILIAHVYLNASFASRVLLHSLENISINKYKLARSLGFSVWKRFLYIEWITIAPTITSLASTIFLLCFTSFAIVLILGGSPAYNTLEVAIYEAARIDFDIPQAVKLSLIQLSISVVFILASASFKTSVANLKANSHVINLQEYKAWSYFQITIISLFALFFISPLMAIVIDSLDADFIKIFSSKIFIRSLITSLAIATISATFSVIIALLISNTRLDFSQRYRVKNSFLLYILAFSGNLYLAIPSLVLGLGFFLVSLKFEMPLIYWALLALLTANILMSLPFALAIFVPNMQRSAKKYNKLSISLGLSTKQRWLTYQFPHLKNSIYYVFALSFCLSLGDLGVIALFGDDEIITLPWYLYQLMGSYRNSDASGLALILLVLVLSVFMLSNRRDIVKS